MNRSKLKKQAKWLALCLMAAWLVSVAMDWSANRSLAAVALFLWASISGLNILARILRPRTDWEDGGGGTNVDPSMFERVKPQKQQEWRN